ncbi:MAG TPA: TPM domain-containing protein [Thermodesulfobacteriota bacterium]|nr:TPM domain-containing protein [Thermodesulfobacteriota bacterium]
MKADHFFNKEENDCIEASIRKAEANTSGEIAVIIVDESDPYPEAALLGGLAGGVLSAMLISDFFFHDSLWYFLPLSLCCFFPFRLLTARLPNLKSFFLSVKRKDERVKARALQAFYHKGLYKTKHQTGVIFFISLLERKVWVLADQGIHEKMEQEPLNRFAQLVTKGIQEGRAGQALCQAIEKMGALMAEHFPGSPDDTDELPDRVMID